MVLYYIILRFFVSLYINICSTKIIIVSYNTFNLVKTVHNYMYTAYMSI